jgi:soluble lytic murein transglycosylase-like protein
MRYLIILLISTNAYSIDFNSKNVDVVRSIIQAADIVKIPRELLLALCWNESSFRTSLPVRLDGRTPSYGICQVKLETAEYMDRVFKNKVKASTKRLLNYKVNPLYAAQYLKHQLKRYKGNWMLAVDAYNKGHAVSHKSQYVRKVNRSSIKAARHLASIQ